MRFMMMVIPSAQDAAAPDAARSAEARARTKQYTSALQKAGVLLAQDGLFPPSTGVRISYSDLKPTVMDGPSGEAHAGIDGYWIIQVRSREEAIEWAKRAPISDHEVVELR